MNYLAVLHNYYQKKHYLVKLMYLLKIGDEDQDWLKK